MSATPRRGPPILARWPSRRTWTSSWVPAIAGTLGATALGAFAPVTAAAVISLIATLVIIFGLPESRPRVLTSNPEQPNVRKLFGQEQRDCFEVQCDEALSVAVVFGRRGLPAAMSMHFFVMLGFNFFYVAFPVFAVVDLGWSLVETGTFFAVMGLLMAGVQGPVLGWIIRRVSELALIVGGNLVLAAGFWLYDSTSTTMIYLAAVLMAVVNGVMWPSVRSVLSRLAGETYRGAARDSPEAWAPWQAFWVLCSAACCTRASGRAYSSSRQP